MNVIQRAPNLVCHLFAPILYDSQSFDEIATLNNVLRKTKTDATSVSESLSNKEWKIVRKVSDVMYNDTLKDMIEKGQGMQALKVGVHNLI